MYFLKTAALFALVLLACAKEETKNRGKRQQIAFYPRRGARPPPYAVQMEPIVQYSQRDPLYNPSASSKSDDRIYHDDSALYNHYATEPEPIIEIIIKESNESLPTPVPPPVPPQPRPTKEPIQVFYVKYEKKKGYGDSKPRVVYDAPVPALTPVEEHEEIQPEKSDDHEEIPSTYGTETRSAEPSTTLRTIIRPESEVYHSGSSGIRVTFGTDQIPPNNHNKRSDVAATSTKAPPTSVTALPPPGSPKRQHGPYHSLQPVHPRVQPAFPQQRIVNSFPPQQQQLTHNFPNHRQFQGPPNAPIIPPRPQQQRHPITVQGLPEIQQRLPFQNGPPHRISINHPQQPGFPPALSFSHQSVHVQNHPPSLGPPGNFNGDLHQPPHQQQQQQQAQLQYKQQEQAQLQYKQQEQEKQRYHQEQRRQQEVRYREQQRQHEQQRLADQQRQQEQQRLAEQQRQQEHQRKLEQQRIIEQQRQADQQRQQERQRQEEQLRLREQQQRKEQENRLLQEQQYRQQLKYNQAQQPPNDYNRQVQQPIQQPIQQQKPGGEIFKAVPKLEQHYAIRENPLHPGPFPPNPQIQPIQYPETVQNRYPEQPPPAEIQQQQQQQYFSRNPTTTIATTQQQQQQYQYQQQSSVATQQTYQNNQQYFSLNEPTPQQPRTPSSPQQSIWGRPAYQDNEKHKIYATPVSTTNDLGSPSTARSIYTSPSTTPTPTTTAPTTTTPAPTTTVAPKNEAKIKENIANLPDEVPDDIREQLLSSGILGNADIQILDYDKVGGIPIENLPPEALANFYGAGGAAATAASEPIPSIAKRPKTVANAGASGQFSKKPTFTKVEHATLRPGGVEMKVVHFDPNTAQGQAIADQHIREDATHLQPVAIGTRSDAQYNRYLPLKVSGASFPIPDAPELRGRKISSVVVLAPVDYSGFRDNDNGPRDDDNTRQSRMLVGAQPVKFLAGESLKQLVKKPSAENYKKWLDQESRTEPQKQSVVLLVTTPKDDSHGDKEIFMYDVSSQSVSKLAGDLSSAFVNAAESNSDSSDTIDDSAFATK